MKKISYPLFITLALSGPSLHAMKALQTKQDQITKEQQLRPATAEPVGDQAFYKELARLKEAEKDTVSWMPRALYALDEIKKLELKVEQLRLKDPQNTSAKEAIKNRIIAYAQAALTGYNNNAQANALYKSKPQDAAVFDDIYNILCKDAGWSWFEMQWYAKDKR